METALALAARNSCSQVPGLAPSSPDRFVSPWVGHEIGLSNLLVV